MNISVDGGALCADPDKRFGTYHFGANLIRALAHYDTRNKYDVYTFCNPDAPKLSSDRFSYRRLTPSIGWMKLRVSLEETLRPHEIFLGLNQAVPWRSPARLIVWNHGLSYLHNPNLYPDTVRRLTRQLLTMTRRAERIIVTSRRVLEDLAPYAGNTPLHMIPIGIPHDMGPGKELHRKPFFLYVGMNHPVKNIRWIIDTFNNFQKSKAASGYSLLLATDTAAGLSGLSDSIRVVHPDRTELRQLYRTAIALLSASAYESFNIPVLEALSQGCPVIARESAIIPEFHKYVVTTESRDDFIEAMIAAGHGTNKPQRSDRIRREYSWERVVKQIVSLY